MTSEALNGVPLVLSSVADDGELWHVAGTFVLGTRPRSWAHQRALEIVRGGLADVLAWLGEPATVRTHDDVLTMLRKPGQQTSQPAPAPDREWTWKPPMEEPMIPPRLDGYPVPVIADESVPRGTVFVLARWPVAGRGLHATAKITGV